MSKKIMPSPMGETGVDEQMLLDEFSNSFSLYTTGEHTFQGLVAPFLHIGLENGTGRKTLATLLNRDEKVVYGWIRDGIIIRCIHIVHDSQHGYSIAWDKSKIKLCVQSLLHRAREIDFTADMLTELKGVGE